MGILAPFAVVIIVGASLVAWALLDAGIERLSTRAAVVSQSVAVTLTATLDKSRDHMRSLESEQAVRDALNASDDPRAAESMLPALTTLLTRNPTYRQARWIDESGRERIRVIRDAGGSVRPSADLQSKSSRYYVRAGLVAQPGPVMTSPLDLNVERGRVEEPHVPTLRFLVRLVDDQGEPRGLLVVNVDMRSLFAAVEETARAEELELSLLNSRGEWLISPDPSDAFAFMFGRDVALGQRSPELWRRISAAPRGRYTGAGIWAWASAQQPQDPSSGLDNAAPWVVLIHVADADMRRHYATVLAPTGLASLVLLGLFGALARRLSERELSLLRARDRAEAATQARALVSEITGAANAAMSAQEMVYMSLRPLCRATGVDVAVAMFGDEVGMHYIQAGADPGAVGDALEALNESLWIRGLQSAKRPLWLGFSDASSAQAGAEWCERAARAGLTGALGIPIIVDGDVVASCVLLYDRTYRHRKEAFATIVKAGSEALAAEIVSVLMRERANHELTLARETAEEASRAKTEFLAHVSHELRTPLNGVIGAARLMRGELSRVEQRNFLRIVEESGSHLLALINEILDVGKIESGELTFVDEDVDLVTVVDRSLQGLKSLVDSKGVRLLHLADPAMTGMYRADATRVTQIITNLVGNSLKFTDIGKIVVRTRELPSSTQEAAHLEFAIEDSGRGISSENLEQIFERYVQAKPEDKRRPEGVGLGLHISRLLIDRMGGSIAAESPNPNNAYDTPGARFIFEIVVARSALPSPYAPISGLQLSRVWVVEGDAELGDHIARLVESWGAQATHYARFPERPAEPPDIVLHNAALDVPAWVADACAYTEPVARGDVYRHLAPIAVDDESPDDTPLRQLLAENAARRRLVLVVEDNPVNQLILGKFLDLMGFAVEVCASGQEAVDCFEDPARTTFPDCVLMDSNMPIMNGREATLRLREFGVTAPIIAVTADVMADEVQRCIDAGMDGFISKPVDFDHLTTVLLRKLFAETRRRA